jgi:hypothetical protein
MTTTSIEQTPESVYRWAANRLRFERWLLAAEDQLDATPGESTPVSTPAAERISA